MRDLGAGLGQFLRAHPAAFYWIGYSGGVDSHVLVDLCARLRHELGPVFGAIHVHHGLHPEADRWAEHCQHVCAGLALPFQLIRVAVKPKPGQSLEEVARTARYQAFARHVGKDTALLLAHHQDDQAETVLLQLLRGAGPAGIAGMAQVGKIGQGALLRPLLEVPKEELLVYARQSQLTWIDDPSNFDHTLDRNYLRHCILPLIKGRWPSCARTIARSAKHCAEAQEFLAESVRSQLEGAVDRTGGLAIEALLGLDRRQQRWLLREWLRKQGFRSPPAVLLERILKETISAAPDRQPRVVWSEGVVCRYRGRLYALPLHVSQDPNWQCAWDGQKPLLLPDGSVLEPRPAFGAGIAARWWREGGIQVRYRRGGERCRLPGRCGHKTLKKLFQEQNVPPWMRARLPLIYLADKLAAVADLWVCEPFAARPDEVGMVLSWQGLAGQNVMIK
ncbi:MAG: tRNA lysidine(34) synthetase TilS [Methylohalobius sp.]|nr:tRNA lysidine(34) synthetase TilS [Methylohalobius sp.]